jgi:hypothetical protein
LDLRLAVSNLLISNHLLQWKESEEFGTVNDFGWDEVLAEFPNGAVL